MQIRSTAKLYVLILTNLCAASNDGDNVAAHRKENEYNVKIDR